MKFTLNPEITYITAFASMLHLSQSDYVLLGAKAGDVFFIHATSAVQPGFILRFGAAGTDAEEVEQALSELGFSSDLVAIALGLRAAGYDAIHLDLDMDLLPGAPWYMESGSKVIPLAYDLPLLYWHDLDDAQKEMACSEACVDLDNGEDYFVQEGTQFIYLPADNGSPEWLYQLSDFLRLDGTETGEHFDGYSSETAFSSVVIKLSDDSESVNLARVTN